MYFMICSRGRSKDKTFRNNIGEIIPCICDEEGDPLRHASWQEVSFSEFRRQIGAIVSTFPVVPEERNEEQRHVSLFVHGYNNSWEDSVRRYLDLRKHLYSGESSLGLLVLLAWPSNGRTTSYLPDRVDAEACSRGLGEVFVRLYDHLVEQQRRAAEIDDPERLCRAKLSIIAHSMGNYVVQKALAAASKRLNNPQLITMIHQLVMVAADVDNDIFDMRKPDDSDGSLMANLCYRICAMFSGLDQVLGASAGLKHFGTRRLGRSGLAAPAAVWDNVFELDVTPVIRDAKKPHSGVFDTKEARQLLADVLRGIDRKLLPIPAQTT